MSYRHILISVALLAAATIAIAWASEIFGGLAPCALCLQQRLPYYVAVPILWIMVMVGQRGAAYPWLIALVGGVFLISAGLAGYHAGVEYGWWAGPDTCGGGGGLPSSTAALAEALKSAKVVRCDEAAFSLFGISMAGYNFLMSLLLAGLCGAGFRAARQAT
jgi:disulfide bond formation protein DsbB